MADFMAAILNDVRVAPSFGGHHRLYIVKGLVNLPIKLNNAPNPPLWRCGFDCTVEGSAFCLKLFVVA